MFLPQEINSLHIERAVDHLSSSVTMTMQKKAAQMLVLFLNESTRRI